MLCEHLRCRACNATDHANNEMVCTKFSCAQTNQKFDKENGKCMDGAKRNTENKEHTK